MRLRPHWRTVHHLSLIKDVAHQNEKLSYNVYPVTVPKEQSLLICHPSSVKRGLTILTFKRLFLKRPSDRGYADVQFTICP